MPRTACQGSIRDRPMTVEQSLWYNQLQTTHKHTHTEQTTRLRVQICWGKLIYLLPVFYYEQQRAQTGVFYCKGPLPMKLQEPCGCLVHSFNFVDVCLQQGKWKWKKEDAVCVCVWVCVCVSAAARLTPLCRLSLPPLHKPIHPHQSAIKQLCNGAAMTVTVGMCISVRVCVCVCVCVKERQGGWEDQRRFATKIVLISVQYLHYITPLSLPHFCSVLSPLTPPSAFVTVICSGEPELNL